MGVTFVSVPVSVSIALNKSWGVELCEPLGGLVWLAVCPGVLLHAVWPPSLLSRAPWELGWGWAALGFLGNSREEPGNTSSGRKAATAARELEGQPGQAGARHCLCHRPAFLPLAPPCATQFGPEQLLV